MDYFDKIIVLYANEYELRKFKLLYKSLNATFQNISHIQAISEAYNSGSEKLLIISDFFNTSDLSRINFEKSQLESYCFKGELDLVGIPYQKKNSFFLCKYSKIKCYYINRRLMKMAIDTGTLPTNLWSDLNDNEFVGTYCKYINFDLFTLSFLINIILLLLFFSDTERKLKSLFLIGISVLFFLFIRENYF